MPTGLHHSVYDYGGASGSIWDLAKGAAAPLMGRMEGQESCDVAVVGGGLVGLCTAYHLAKVHQASVILLEAARPGWGSTSRGLGVAGISPFLNYKPILDASGTNALSAERLLAADRAGLGLMDALAVNEGIDMARAGEGVLALARSTTELSEYEALAARIGLVPGTDYDVLGPDQLATDWLQSPRMTGALWLKEGYGLDPTALTDGLMQACLKLGVRMFANTRVRGLEERRGAVTVRYRGGTLNTSTVVMATHAFSRGRAIPELADQALHVLFHGIATRPLSDAELVGSGLRKPCVLRLEDELLGTTLVRVLPDRRVALTTTVSLDADPSKSQEVRARLRVLLLSIVPGLRDIPLPSSWRGVSARRQSRLPAIGPLSDSGRLLFAGGLDYDSANLAVWLGAQGARLAAGDQSVLTEPFVIPERLPRISFGEWRQKWLGYKISRAEPVL